MEEKQFREAIIKDSNKILNELVSQNKAIPEKQQTISGMKNF